VTIGAVSVASRVLSTVGAGLVALAVFVPYAEFDGESTSILDLDAFELTYGFAIEPLAVALAALSPLFLTRVSPRLLAMLLGAIGAQTALMFLGYLLLATQEGNDPGAGSIVGLAGALLIFTAGALGLRAHEPVTALEASSLPSAGWYPDPTTAASERFWDGGAWTEETR
jgi:hypothetical protein